jgi:16S rRNA (guanine527-N7)-methyltransferase
MDLIKQYFEEFSPKQQLQFSALENLYASWNEKINVISRKDMENFYEHHVLHSLAIATQFDFPAGYNILDIGTGGGFPGIPLAIFFPEVHFHLADSIHKKLKVVDEVSAAIGLSNITTQHTRVENIKDRKFDIIVSRAVAPLKDLWFWSKPLLLKRPIDQPKKLSGLICLKGGDLSREISESRLRPRIWEIEKIFEQDFFKQKYILHTNP